MLRAYNFILYLNRGMRYDDFRGTKKTFYFVMLPRRSVPK
jgi:hypothetical protein